jgi:hypothetical protein
LPSERHHPDQHLRVQRRGLRVAAAGAEEVGQDVLHLASDVAEQRAVGSGTRSGIGVPDQDAEPVSVVFDVLEQVDSRRLVLLAGVGALKQQRGGHREQPLHLAVDHDGVQPFLAAEVLIHDRLGNTGLRGHFLDGRAFESSLGEQSPTDVQ